MTFVRKVVVLFLLMFSVSAFALSDSSDFVIRDGKMKFPVTDYNSNGFRKWFNLTDRCYETEYCAKHDVNRHARDAATRARTTAPVPATLNTSVPKKNVFQGLLANAKKFKKVGGGWPGLAFSLVAPWLAQEGYEWLEEQQDFVKPMNGVAKICGGFSGEISNACSDSRYISFVYPPFSHQDLNFEAQKICVAIGKQRYGSTYPVYGYQGYCFAKINEQSSYLVHSGNINIIILNNNLNPLNQSEFDRIIQPHADNDPSPYVNLSRPEQNAPVPGMSAPTVTVADGTVATTSPFTNPVTGQPQQIKFTFNTTNNVTNVRSVNINRPDLAPGSAEAPLPEGGPDDDTASEPAPRDASQPNDLCAKHPDILACQKLGEPNADMFSDLSIPHKVDNTTWSPDDFLPPHGVCPQPKTFHVLGKEYQASYEPLCRIMEQARFVVLLAFIVMSAYIVFGGLRTK